MPLMINDLKFRLHHRRSITPSLEGTWMEYGINSHVLEDWLAYWEHEYPFKEREEFMNKYPHFTTNIQGLDIHFIRVRPQVPNHVDVVPLLLTNGWPSSFAEFYGVIPRLAVWDKHRNFAVEVIAPTIPGFTLSEVTALLNTCWFKPG
nr:juvenile hormone epoxide hydrolase-like [Plodia interpunctella]